MTLEDKVVQRDQLTAEVRRKLQGYQASGRRLYLRSTIPLESRTIRQLRGILRYWKYQEQTLTQAEESEPITSQADPEPIMGVGTTELRQVVEEMESQEVNGETNAKK